MSLPIPTSQFLASTPSTGENRGVRESPVAIIARNLVLARDIVGMTQHELAARSGISRATVAQLESGAGDPRLSTITDIAEALGVSPLVLLAGKREVLALAGLKQDLADRPIAVQEQDTARMHAFAGSPLHRDQARAARIGASVARNAACRTAGAAATAGVFAVVSHGRAAAVGAALGRLLE